MFILFFARLTESFSCNNKLSFYRLPETFPSDQAAKNIYRKKHNARTQGGVKK
jgi:hypothetical protein